MNKVVGKDIYEAYTQGIAEAEKNLIAEKTKARLNINVQEEILSQRRDQLPVLISNVHYLEDDPQLK